MGSARRLAGRARHAVGGRALLGTGQHGVQGADRARPSDRRRGGRIQGRAARRAVAADAGLVVARNGSRRRDRHRQWRGVCLCRRRGCHAGHARQSVGRAGRSSVRRRAQLGSDPAGTEFAPRRALCAGRSDRQGAVVERQPDRIVEPLQGADGCQRPRLSRHLRRHGLLLRPRTIGKAMMRARAPRLGIVVGFAALSGALCFAQVGRGGSRWLTAFGDAQRTSWVRIDDKISTQTMAGPGFGLQWSKKLDNQPRGPYGLRQGVTASGVTLFVPMSLVAGSSNTVFALDNDLGYVVWQRRFDVSMPAPTTACPGGMTSAATRIVPLDATATTATANPFGGGRGAVGYRSLLGEPGQGVPVEGRSTGAARRNDPPPSPAPAARGTAPALQPPLPGARAG